jgi:hypothetical protein
VSQEPFLANNDLITNMMLRASWGVTGNQNISAGRTVDFFGGSPGTSSYDITGSDTRVAQGFRQTAIGNPDLKWEENQSTNLGIDLEFMGSSVLVLDLYERNSDNLLSNPPIPATAGAASAPIVNVGQIRNRGIDAQLGLRGTLANDVRWNLDLNGSRYQNEIVRIDGSRDFFYGPITTRFATTAVTINQIGHPVGSFFGFVSEGMYQNQAEIDALDAQAQQQTGRSDAQYHSGAEPGRLRFKDTNGDGVLTQADRTIIGSPHPDFVLGTTLGLNWRSFDLGVDFFGTFGNEIYDVQKEFYIFRHFYSNVRRDLLENSAQVVSGEVTNPSAKYPRLDVTDNISREPSTFYIEDGSYVRLRSLQLGYTAPRGWLGAFNVARIYIRGENLFTITGYDGLDPALPAANVSSAAGDIADQARGIDRGAYPTNRTVTVGVSVGF